jgi:hypothetical protein
MRVKQTANLSIHSDDVDGKAITRRLGVIPDHMWPKRSSTTSHGWRISATGKEWAGSRGAERDESLTVTSQVVEICRRMEAAKEALRSLTLLPGTEAWLNAVRWYFPSDDESELSFVLDTEVIQFLSETGTQFNFSEYDMSLATDEELREEMSR